jgi:quinone-modifying oxidoreductase subunit QmoC
MADSRLVEADVNFVKQLKAMGGDTLKKCYQCATCSVVCPISPDESPFPRKEMVAAQWGLKDRLVGNMDVWLCHYCGDCSTYCPRGAKPGDVLNAARAMTISEYAWPSCLGRIVPDSSKWWLLLAIPIVLFLIILGATGHLHIPEGEIEFAHFFPTLIVDLIFVPLAMLWIPITFGIGLKKFVNDIHENAVADGRAKRKDFVLGEFLKSLVCVISTIFKHNKFEECTENKDRYLPHLLVFYSFLGLFVVTNVFFVALYILQIPGPYSQLNPVKILANVSGFALVIGAIWMMTNRSKKAAEDGGSTGSYFDWSLLILVLALGVTGLLSQFTRLLGLSAIAYPMYFIHLVFVFCLFAYLPFGKLAHLVYRTVAMAYAHYSGREPCEASSDHH